MMKELSEFLNKERKILLLINVKKIFLKENIHDFHELYIIINGKYINFYFTYYKMIIYNLRSLGFNVFIISDNNWLINKSINLKEIFYLF